MVTSDDSRPMIEYRADVAPVELPANDGGKVAVAFERRRHAAWANIECLAPCAPLAMARVRCIHSTKRTWRSLTPGTCVEVYRAQPPPLTSWNARAKRPACWSSAGVAGRCVGRDAARHWN